jgi:rhodanese-related sulfurtransferase
MPSGSPTPVIPLTQLNEKLVTLDATKPTIVYCASGFRSSTAASRMAVAGFTDVSDLLGGYGAWQAARAARPMPDGADDPITGDG